MPKVGEDASEGKAAKDCRTCTKRRIRCDRGLPTCFKCSKKGVTCPGYGLNLRWSEAYPGGQRTLKDGSTVSETSRATRSTSTPSAGVITPPAAAPPMTTIVTINGGSPGLAQTIPEFENASTAILPPPEIIEMLLEYFDKRLAGLTVWVDSDSNPYRRRVIPLARSHSGLLLSILAVSAQHLSPNPMLEEKFPLQARDAAVRIITQHVQIVGGRLSNSDTLSRGIDMPTAEWMLASMMLLASYELVDFGASVAETHRHAAKTLVKVIASSRQPTSDLYLFLQSQLDIYSVFASTTTLDIPDEIEDRPLVTRAEYDLFADYLRVLRGITIRSHNLPLIPPSPAAIIEDMAQIIESFTLAKGMTLMLAGRLPFISETLRHDFIRITEVFHEAALLYACNVLNLQPNPQFSVKRHCQILAGHIRAIRVEEAFLQDMPWPLFVLGVCCVPAPAVCPESGGVKEEREGQLEEWIVEMREVVADYFERVVVSTGYRNYREVLGFLQEYWEDGRRDWVGLVREWQRVGKTVVAV